MNRLALFAALFLSTTLSVAAIRTENVSYTHGNVKLQGYLAYDDTMKEKRPGILVVHEWWGLNNFARQRAEQMAELGFVALAVDMYGQGQVTDDPKKAGEWSGIYKGDRKLMRGRANAGLKALKASLLVDSKKIAAIGFCFGGTTALELARSGADVKGVVSFHGGLDTPNPKDAKNIRGKVLVLHGADDPYVPAAQVAAFEDEMRAAKVNWQLNKYSGAVHAYTNPAAGNDNSKGAAYNASAEHRSWIAMEDFFDEIFQ